MSTYVFITDPERFDSDAIRNSNGGTWSCSKTTKKGDKLFVYLTGGIGIKHEWEATSSKPRRDKKWRFNCDVRYVRDFDSPITIDELRTEFSKDEWGAPYSNFRGLRSIGIDDRIADRIRRLRDGKKRNVSSKTNNSAIGKEEQFVEGELRTYQATTRNPQLRSAAKRKWGLKCYCCGFDYEQFYGDLAKGVAIVHHLKTFASANGKKRKATVNDVRVVCANCHYVIHLTEPPLDPDYLKRLISERTT